MKPFANATDLLALSPSQDWAVGHFNIHNYEFARAIAEAARLENSPAIMAIGMGSVRYAGMYPLFAIAQAVNQDYNVPICLHLDHAKEIDVVRQALKMGFSSVMFDGSALPHAENLRITAEVVKMAHDHGATAEGEIGVVPMEAKALSKDDFTSPEALIEFVEKTGVDFVAVSFGSAHNMTTQEAGLDLDLLKKLHDEIKIPFVLHGASGVIDADLAKAVQIGLRKVNVNTAMKVAMANSFRTSLIDPKLDLLPALSMGTSAVTRLVRAKMKLFGSAGKLSGPVAPAPLPGLGNSNEE